MLLMLSSGVSGKKDGILANGPSRQEYVLWRKCALSIYVGISTLGPCMITPSEVPQANMPLRRREAGIRTIRNGGGSLEKDRS